MVWFGVFVFGLWFVWFCLEFQSTQTVIEEMVWDFGISCQWLDCGSTEFTFACVGWLVWINTLNSCGVEAWYRLWLRN